MYKLLGIWHNTPCVRSWVKFFCSAVKTSYHKDSRPQLHQISRTLINIEIWQSSPCVGQRVVYQSLAIAVNPWPNNKYLISRQDKAARVVERYWRACDQNGPCLRCKTVFLIPIISQINNRVPPDKCAGIIYHWINWCSPTWPCICCSIINCRVVYVYDEVFVIVNDTWKSLNIFHKFHKAKIII